MQVRVETARGEQLGVAARLDDAAGVEDADPVAAGLVQSLSRPGGNVTGVSRQTPELVAKQIQLLKEVLPKTARVGLLVDSPERVRPVIVGVVKDTAESLGVRSTVLAPGTTAEIDAAFATLRAEQADAVLVLGGGVFFPTRLRIAELAQKTRLASMFEFASRSTPAG